MPVVLVTIFTIIGIVFACIGGFIVFAFVTPFTYKVEASYHEKPDVYVRAAWLLGLLRILVTYAEDKPRVLVKLLFFTVFDSSKPKKKKKKKKKKGKKRNVKRKAAVKDDDTKPFEIQEEEDVSAEKTAKEKFIAVMDKIVDFLKAAGEKLDVVAEWLDADHRRLYAFLWTNGVKIFKKIRPKRFEAFISGGTGDPSSTGMIVSVISVILGLTGIDSVRLDPDFENKRIDADVSAYGRFFVFPVLLIALKIYRNRDFRKFILKK